MTKGFWNILTFFSTNFVNNPTHIAASKRLPNNLFGIVQSIWNITKMYHSCNISKGVVKRFVDLPIITSLKTINRIVQAMLLKITTGIYIYI